MEWMLPSALADNAQKHHFSRMHVWISVVRLVRVFERVVRIHVVGHGAAIDHEVSGVVWLGGNLQAATLCTGGAVALGRSLGQCRRVNLRIHLRELEQVFAVVN